MYNKVLCALLFPRSSDYHKSTQNPVNLAEASVEDREKSPNPVTSGSNQDWQGCESNSAQDTRAQYCPVSETHSHHL